MQGTQLTLDKLSCTLTNVIFVFIFELELLLEIAIIFPHKRYNNAVYTILLVWPT